MEVLRCDTLRGYDALVPLKKSSIEYSSFLCKLFATLLLSSQIKNEVW